MTTVSNSLNCIRERQVTLFGLLEHNSGPIFGRVLQSGHSQVNVFDNELDLTPEFNFLDEIPIPLTNLALPLKLDFLSTQHRVHFDNKPIVPASYESVFLTRIAKRVSRMSPSEPIEGAYHVHSSTNNFQRYFSARMHISPAADIIPHDIESRIVKLGNRFCLKQGKLIVARELVEQISFYILMQDNEWYCHPCKILLFPRHALPESGFV